MKAKKNLGQNFLTRDHYAIIMAEKAMVGQKDTVLEIGPGKGILTAILLKKAGHVIAVEKDPELVVFLKERFANEIKKQKLTLVSGDIFTYHLPPITYKLIANIPYYITGEIIRHFLSNDKQPQSLTLMVQKEVAERIVARNKKESLLSLSVKAYGEPEIVARVSAGNFFPKPKVDSAIIHIAGISKNFFKKIDEKKFFEIIHVGFAHKRKMLLPNLSSFGKEKMEKIFDELHISKKVRAEDLTPQNWRELTQMLY